MSKCTSMSLEQHVPSNIYEPLGQVDLSPAETNNVESRARHHGHNTRSASRRVDAVVGNGNHPPPYVTDDVLGSSDDPMNVDTNIISTETPAKFNSLLNDDASVASSASGHSEIVVLSSSLGDNVDTHTLENREASISSATLTTPSYFSDSVPDVDITKRDAFIGKLYVMLTKKGVPRYLFSDVIKTINDGVESGVLSSNAQPLPVSRDASFNMMKNFFPFPEPIKKFIQLESSSNDHMSIDPNLAKRDRQQVMVFDIKEMVEDIIHSPDFRNFENLSVDRTNPFQPKKKIILSDGIANGEECYLINGCDAGRVFESIYESHNLDTKKGDFVTPLTFYMDKTGTSPNLRWGVEPLIFTTSLFNIAHRNKRDGRAWRVAGYVPDNMRSAAAKSVGSQTKKGTGREGRNYHLVLSAILDSLRTANEHYNKTKTWVFIGDKMKHVCIHIMVFFLIGDAKSQDHNCLRYASYNCNRISRSCDCLQKDADNASHICKFIDSQPIEDLLQKARVKGNNKDLVEDEDEKQTARNELKELSISLSHNAWLDHPFADPTRKIFGSTPTDVCHILLLGVIPYVLRIHQTAMTDSQRANVDNVVDQCFCTFSSSETRNYFTTNCARGLTNLTLLTADEWVGALFTYLILAQLPKGFDMMKTAFTRHRDETYENSLKSTKTDKNNETEEIIPKSPLNINDFKTILEDILIFHEWLKRGHPYRWNDRLESLYQNRVIELMKDIMRHFPREAGNGWKIQKMHELLHLVPDIKRFGSPSNFDAGIGELLLQAFAKHPASTSRSLSPDQYMESIATRYHEQMVMRKFKDHLEKHGHVFHTKTETSDAEPIDRSAMEYSNNDPIPISESSDSGSDEDDSLSGSSIEKLNDDESTNSSNEFNPLHKLPDWTMTFVSRTNQFTLEGRERCSRKVKVELHPMVKRHLVDAYLGTDETIQGCYSVKKSWHDDRLKQQRNVTFRCDPDYCSQGKPWYDFAMVLFDGLDEEQMTTQEMKTKKSNGLPPGRFSFSFFPSKVLCFYTVMSSGEMRAVVHPCTYNDHKNDTRLTERWELDYETKDHLTHFSYDTVRKKAKAKGKAKDDNEDDVHHLYVGTYKQPERIICDGKKLLSKVATTQEGDLKRESYFFYDEKGNRKNRLVPVIQNVSTDVIDRRIYVIEETPQLNETISLEDEKNKTKSRTVVFIRDRTHWPEYFIRDKSLDIG